MLYGDAVSVPAKTARCVVTRDMGVACDDILPLEVSRWHPNKEIKHLDGTSE
jgi:hypothetical protein